ncbi:ribosome small subunit-dependent GTPase A [Bergeyella zoohelcum]|uniref:ribosome small subunit-dependent GTPase A n=1 Tax=Bergeyella zoohelcum TaxID=1015 RepID=UPI002A91C780|nr:ribosome small subunit-dependent GTPase A [Bergeyella zoohelcum]MDY6026388.1 ribosome small subunit-dependent GTPase A [Bergeyella zoohelcum]
MTGTITKSTGSWYQVLENKSGLFYEARIRGKFKLKKIRLTNPLAVGDKVDFEMDTDGIAWVTHIHPRENYLIRKSVNLSKEAHIIASNVDIACFLFTVKNPETSLGFLDRFLACCEAYSIPPLIIFNKIDLLTDADREVLSIIQEIYKPLPYSMLEVSAQTGENLATLKDILKDKISVFFGHSGAGKSTLVNALQSDLNLKTSEISEVHLKGKHTTTFAQMHFWDFGGSVIDTPGVREFAMIDVEREEIQHFFPEIFEIGRTCKYHNCLHINEPQCQVLTAIETGEISDTRYATYTKLLDEELENRKF